MDRPSSTDAAIALDQLELISRSSSANIDHRNVGEEDQGDNTVRPYVCNTEAPLTTSQIPHLLHILICHTKGKLVACTQPRRVAAMSVAKRVADGNDGANPFYTTMYCAELQPSTVPLGRQLALHSLRGHERSLARPFSNI